MTDIGVNLPQWVMQSYMKALDAKIAYGVYSDECLSQGVYCSSVKKKRKIFTGPTYK